MLYTLIGAIILSINIQVPRSQHAPIAIMTSGMHRRPFEGRYLVYLLCIIHGICNACVRKLLRIMQDIYYLQDNTQDIILQTCLLFHIKTRLLINRGPFGTHVLM